MISSSSVVHFSRVNCTPHVMGSLTEQIGQGAGKSAVLNSLIGHPALVSSFAFCFFSPNVWFSVYMRISIHSYIGLMSIGNKMTVFRFKSLKIGSVY